eukprot:4150884-Pleurochrysis_carterae.AAC.1
MQVHLAHIQPNNGPLPYVPLSDFQALLQPFGPGTLMPAADPPSAPATMACASTAPSAASSTS